MRKNYFAPMARSIAFSVNENIAASDIVNATPGGGGVQTTPDGMCFFECKDENGNVCKTFTNKTEIGLYAEVMAHFLTHCDGDVEAAKAMALEQLGPLFDLFG